MKKEYSSKWIASKNPKKQRKYLIKSPIHRKKKQLSANLSKKLREKYGRRNIPVRKGDKVKILRGKFKKKEAKIIRILTSKLKIYLEGIQTTKTDGSKVEVPFKASNLQIVELNNEDNKRMKIKKETTKKENKNVKVEENKK